MKTKLHLSKTAILVSILFFTHTILYSQTSTNIGNINCKEQITTLNSTYNKHLKLLQETANKINRLKSTYTTSSLKEINTLFKLAITYNDSLLTIYNKMSNYKAVCTDLGVKKDSINTWFKHKKPKQIDKPEPEEPKTQTFIYFNKKQIIKEDVFNKGTIEHKILNDALSQANKETYLGDISIPKDGEAFYFYNSPNEKDINDKRYKFKKISIQIKDGNFSDIKVTVLYNGKFYDFENLIGISIFRFRRKARENYLFYSSKNAQSTDDSEISNLRIRLSDVLDYNYKIGNHYLPTDLVLELPEKDINNKQTNLEAKPIYQIKENTYLDKIVELRAYTDFLAVFSDKSNGLLQLEGSAKFYLFPYPHQFPYTSQIELFKSISPYVHFSRFENEDKQIGITNQLFDNELSLIEKRYLTMGAHTSLVELYHKKYPLKAQIFGSLNYNLTEIQDPNGNSEDIKSIGYGIGLNLSTKRFNNFGFNYMIKAEWFNFKEYNTTNTVDTNITIPVLENQAEVFYHPTDNPNQAIFARLGVFNYMGSTNNNAFYQFQFGYKFSIGSRKIADKAL